MNHSIEVIIGVILATSMLVIAIYFVGEAVDSRYHSLEKYCDYDSCSIQLQSWSYNGSSCFDSNKLECQDFLRLWNVCQEGKRYLGVC